MRLTYEFDEDEIRQAIAHFASRQGSADFNASDVGLFSEVDAASGVVRITAIAKEMQK